MTGPCTSRAIAWTASKSPGEVIGKPASMMSTPSRASWFAISTFSWRLSEIPGDCSPSRSVVSKIFTRLLSSLAMSVPFCALPVFSCARGFSGRHASFPPKGEKEKSQVEQERHVVLGYTPWPTGTRSSRLATAAARGHRGRVPRVAAVEGEGQALRLGAARCGSRDRRGAGRRSVRTGRSWARAWSTRSRSRRCWPTTRTSSSRRRTSTATRSSWCASTGSRGRGPSRGRDRGLAGQKVRTTLPMFLRSLR